MPRTLVISDIHEPVVHPGAFDFIDSVAQKVQPDRIVFIGDIVDHHGISYWTKHPAAPGPKDEYEMSLIGVQRWYEAYPDADVMIGNHDDRPVRMAEKAGVPGAYLKDYATVWQTPGWRWLDKVVYEDTLYTHSVGAGMNPAALRASKIGMSVVAGHVHTTLGIKWFGNDVKRWFGMDVGSLIDSRLYAFAYCKGNALSQLLGCGVVDSDDPMETRVIAMPKGRGEEFDRRHYPVHPLLKGRMA